MVSFNSSPHHQHWHNLSADHNYKRKRGHHHVVEDDQLSERTTTSSSSQRAKTINYDSLLGIGIELPLLAPLPLEWQRCLDIKSGQVYFYNTRTQEKMSRDPRLRRREPPVKLDLELNLLCGGSSEQHVGDNFTETQVSAGGNQTRNNNSDGGKKRSGVFLRLARSPSWLRFDGDEEEEEMVTAACKECHMLVMVCKTAPTCPNCKCVSLPPGRQFGSNVVAQ